MRARELAPRLRGMLLKGAALFVIVNAVQLAARFHACKQVVHHEMAFLRIVVDAGSLVRRDVHDSMPHTIRHATRDPVCSDPDRTIS